MILSCTEQTNISEYLTNNHIGTLVRLVIQNIIFSLHVHSPPEQTSLKYCTKHVLEENIQYVFHFCTFPSDGSYILCIR